MSTIYIVAGSRGEYSDREDWNVCAYDTEAAAQARITALDALLLKHGLAETSPPNYNLPMRDESIEAMRAEPNGDPYFKTDYFSGTSYSYSACELVTS